MQHGTLAQKKTWQVSKKDLTSKSRAELHEHVVIWVPLFDVLAFHRSALPVQSPFSFDQTRSFHAGTHHPRVVAHRSGVDHERSMIPGAPLPSGLHGLQQQHGSPLQ